MNLTDAQAASLYQSGAGEAKAVILIDAVRQSDSQSVMLAFWNGEETTTIPIDGINRDCVGLGLNLDFGQIEYFTGLAVGRHEVKLNGALAEAREIVRNHIYILRPVEIHHIHLDPSSGALIGTRRLFKGIIDQAPEEVGGGANGLYFTMTIVSRMRKMTEHHNKNSSNAAHEAAAPFTDTFFRDNSVTDAADDPVT